MIFRVLFFVFLTWNASALATEVKEIGSVNLGELYESDQKDRKNDIDKIDWNAISVRDSERQVKIMLMLRHGSIKTAKEYWQAAVIYQHGSTIEQIKIAYSFAQIAMALDPDMKAARWLAAASWDRIMVQSKLPQWYGTQFTKSSATGKWELYEINESIISDEERMKFDIPPLKLIREQIEGMNKK